MRFHSNKKEDLLGRLASLLLMTIFLFPHQTHAATATIEAPGPQLAILGEIGLSTGVTAASTGAQASKDLFKDGLAWALTNIAINLMSSNIVDWINSGFDGNPAFVTDLEGFLLSVADETLGAYLESGDLAHLCDPFAFQIRQALEYNYARAKRIDINCSLKETVEDIESFIDGNFEEGGWRGWFELSVNDNPHKRYLETERELNKRIEDRKEREGKILDWGGGYRSLADCNGVGSSGTLCSILTPGKTIQTTLEKALELPADKLVVADEFNEIVGALLNQLTIQVLNSTGIRGVSRSSGGQPSYTQQLREEAARESQKHNPEANIKAVEEAIQTEEETRDAMNEAFASLSFVEELNTQLSSIDSVTASNFAGLISEKKERVGSISTVAESNIRSLELIKTELADITEETDTEETINILGKWALLQQSGTLHTRAEFLSIVREVEDLQSNVESALNSS